MTPDDTPPLSSPSTLSPAEAEAIFAEDLGNILLKVQEKRPLTQREREVIRERTVDRGEDDGSLPPADVPKWAKTVVDLAAVLGVDRRTIGNWRQLPGCPAPRSNGQYLVADWQEFARKIDSPAATGPTAVGSPDGKRELEERKLRAECEDREFRNAVKRNEYTHNSVIGEQITALVQEATSVLRAKFERELPLEYTTDAELNRQINKAAIDEVCERIARPLPCQEVAPSLEVDGE